MKRVLAWMLRQFMGASKSMEITIEQLKSLPRDHVLVDVREPEEWAFCRIDGAVHIPLAEMRERCQELPADRELVFYCHHGMRSLAAVKIAREFDLERSFSLAGGIDAWSRRVDPSVPRY